MARGSSRRRAPGPRVPGVVLEVAGRRASVLADGHFLRMRAIPGWGPGQEVWVHLPVPGIAWPAVRQVALGLVCTGVAVGGVLGASAFVAAHQVAAVVAVDVNPSVQLGVNSQGRVVWAKAVQPKSQVLVGPGGLAGRSMDAAAQLIVQRAVQDGLLSAAAAYGQGSASSSTAAGTTPSSTQGSSATSSALSPSSSSSSSAPASSAASSAQRGGGGLSGGLTPGGAPATEPTADLFVTAAPVGQGPLPPGVASQLDRMSGVVDSVLNTDKVHTQVAAVEAGPGVWGEAENSGLSVGQQAIYDALHQAGLPVQQSAFKSEGSLRKILQHSGIPAKEVGAVEAALAHGNQAVLNAVVTAIRRGNASGSHGDKSSVDPAGQKTDKGSPAAQGKGGALALLPTGQGLPTGLATAGHAPASSSGGSQSHGDASQSSASQPAAPAPPQQTASGTGKGGVLAWLLSLYQGGSHRSGARHQHTQKHDGQKRSQGHDKRQQQHTGG